MEIFGSSPHFVFISIICGSTKGCYLRVVKGELVYLAYKWRRALGTTHGLDFAVRSLLKYSTTHLEILSLE